MSLQTRLSKKRRLTSSLYQHYIQYQHWFASFIDLIIEKKISESRVNLGGGNTGFFKWAICSFFIAKSLLSITDKKIKIRRSTDSRQLSNSVHSSLSLKKGSG